MKQSIHLGLNSVNPDYYGGWPGWLNACVADAREMAVLAARAGFTASAVLNEDATVERLESDVAAAAGVLVADDTFWITDSGHGGRNPDAWGWDGYRETLCLFNGELADTALRKMLCQFVPGVRVVIDIDACHSGGMDRTGKIIRAKPRFVHSVVEIPGGDRGRLDASILMRTACRNDETAADGDVNGAYTSWLLRVADKTIAEGRQLTWQGWIEETQKVMLRECPSQHPQFSRYGAETDWNVPVTA